jgi:hypothetical protein
MTVRLPDSLLVLERGWLSANNIVCFEGENATVVDSGYVTHAAQTVELVGHALGRSAPGQAGKYPLAFRPHRRQRRFAGSFRLRNHRPERAATRPLRNGMKTPCCSPARGQQSARVSSMTT